MVGGRSRRDCSYRHRDEVESPFLMAYLLDTNHCFRLGFTDNDLWIAASAVERQAILVSEDPDFRRMAALESLNVESWLS